MPEYNPLHNKTTRDQLLHAFFDLLESKSYEEIKIVDICDKAHLSRKTFYTYFENKEDLLDYLAQIISLCYSETDDKSGHYHYFNFFYHMQNSLALLIKNGLWYDITRRVKRKYVDLLYPHDWTKILGEQVDDVDWFLEFMSYGSARLVELWCQSGFQKTPEELSSLVEKIQGNNVF